MRGKMFCTLLLGLLLALAGCGAQAAAHPLPTATRSSSVFPTATSFPTTTSSPTAVAAGIVTSDLTSLPGGPALFALTNDDTLTALSLSNKAVSWRDQLQGGTFSPDAPVVANGVVYVAADQNLYALNANDGSVRWRYAADVELAMPAVANGAVFVVVSGGILALNASDGSVRWQQPLSSALPSTPLVSDGVIYLGTTDGIYALDAQDGSQRWHHPFTGGVVSGPVLADGALYLVAMDGNIYSLNTADGSLRWQAVYGVIATAGPLLAADDSSLYLEMIEGTSATGTLGSVEALDSGSGAQRWPGKSLPAGTLTIDSGTLYVSGGNAVEALNAGDGTQRWSASGVGSSQAWVSNGLLYVGSVDGNVSALNTGDGSIAWQAQLGSRVLALTLGQ